MQGAKRRAAIEFARDIDVHTRYFRACGALLTTNSSIASRIRHSCRPLDPSEEDLSSGEVLSEEWNGTFPAPAQPPSPTHVFRDDVRGGSSTPNLRRASR